MFVVRYYDPEYHCKMYDGSLIDDLRSFVHELLRYKLSFEIEFVSYDQIFINFEDE